MVFSELGTIFIGYFLLVIFFPIIGLFTVILSFSLPYSFYNNFGFFGELVFLITILAFFTRVIKNRMWMTLSGRKILLALVPFMATLSITGLYHFTVTRSVDLKIIAMYLFVWLELPLAYILASNLIKNKNAIKYLTYACVVSAGVMSYYALKMGFLDNRLHAGLSSSNTLALYLSVIFPIIPALFLITWSRIEKGVILLLGAFIFFVLLMTFSRGAVLSLGAGLVIWLMGIMMGLKKRKATIFLILLLLSCTILLSLFVMNSEEGVRYSIQSIVDAAQGRIQIYTSMISFIGIKEFFVGVGPDNFKTLIFGGHMTRVVTSHNLFLALLGETGIFGLLGCLFFMIVVIKTALFNLKVIKEDTSFYILGLSLAVTLPVFLLHHLVDMNMGHGIGIQLGINLGLLHAMRNIKQAEL